MNLLIIGAGGHGHIVKEVAESLKIYDNIAFLDDNSQVAIGRLCDYEKYRDEYEQAFVAIGNCELRIHWIHKLLKVGYKIPVLTHPSAYISSSSCINIGTIIMVGAIIQSNVKIGEGCIISSGAIVDHDSVIGNYCHVNAGAIIPSMSNLKDNTKVDYGITYKFYSR